MTPNLTPVPSSFIGRATREEFIGRFKAFQGMDAEISPVAPEGRNTVMPWIALSGMTEEDLGAIYDYLRTLPPCAATPRHDRVPAGLPRRRLEDGLTGLRLCRTPPTPL